MGLKKIYGWVFVMFLMGSLNLRVSAQQYSFYYPEVNKQLPQQFVYSLTTDSLGYLWVGTGEGIVKYDGTRLIPVKVNKQASKNFCSVISKIGPTMVAGFFDGSVAIGTGDNLVQLKNAASGKIVAVAGISDRLFVASQSEVYEIKDNKLQSFKSFTSGEVICGLVSKSKKLYLATSNGLLTLDPETKKTEQLSKEPVYSICEGDNKTVVLGLSTVYSLTGSTLKPIYLLTDPGSQFSPENAIAIADNNVYVSWDNRLIEITPKGSKSFQVGEEGFLVKSIHAESNQLWLGTYGNGLCYFNPLSYSYYELQKQAVGTVALLSNKKKLIELRTNSVALYTLSAQGLPEFPASRVFPFAGTASCAFKDGEDVLIGTEQGSVLKFSANSTLSPASSYTRNLPAGKAILDIYTKSNDVYISVAQHGVFHFQKNGSLIENLTTANGLLHNDIIKVYTDSQERTWFLSQSSGLAYRKNGEFKYLTLNDGLSSLEFSDIVEDPQKNVWMSTEGGGLTKLATGSIENYNLSSGLSSDYYYGLASDGKRLYSYSRGGVNVLVDNQLRKIESAEIGIVPNFQPRAITVGDNFVAIGSEYGPVIHYLKQLFPANTVKLVVKQALVNDNKTLNNGTNLDYGDYKMEFMVEQINLNPFFTPTVEFKLIGFDKDWQTLEKSSVIYQSIKDNNYRFVVRDKLFAGNKYDFDFSVEKPFWKKPLYYVFFFLILAIGIYIVFRLRIRQLEQRNRELEVKVADRTAELRRKNTELEQFIFAMSHDLKNPAVNMVELANLLKDVLNTNIDMAKEVANQLTTVSGKMLNNLLELIDLLKFTNSKELPKENVSIVELIETVKASISKSIDEANAEFNIDLTAFDHLVFNRSNLQSVLYNLISNAVKYRKPGQKAVIDIKSFIIDAQPAITVRDNGMGIDLEANKDRLFGIFQRMHHHVEGTGIGLHLVKSIMEKHGGTIEVESQPGVGTTFTLIFASLR